MSNINIGDKIKERRQLKKWSMRELAAKTGLTASLLSQLENNKSNPSINTLKILANALETPLIDFFADDQEAQDMVVRRDQRKKMIFPQNKDFAYELLTPDTKGTIEFLLMTLMPHTESSEAVIGHNAEEVAFVMEGKVDFYMEQENFTLYKGDSIRILPNVRHKWVNHSSDPAEVIFALTPPTF